MNDDLISREYVEGIVEELENICQNAPEEVLNLLSKVKNAPPVLFPLTVMINDKLTDEDIELLKRQMKDYKPQVLNLELERPESKWIPVSKQLPDKYDSYLVMWRSLTEGYPDRLFYEICEYVPEEDEWERIDQAGEAGAEIIAWMPLPKPYKEGEEK